MSRTGRSVLKRLMVACVCAGAFGCSGSLFQSRLAPASAYALAGRGAGPAAAAQSAAPLPVDMTITKPRVRPGLDGERIAALYPDRRLEYYARARWSGSLDDVLQDLMLQAFEERRALRSVSSESTLMVNGYWLETDVEDFQAEYPADRAAPTIRVRLRARLGRVSDHRWIADFSAAASQPASADRMAAIVEAFGRATNTALDQIMDGTERALMQN